MDVAEAQAQLDAAIAAEAAAKNIDPTTLGVEDWRSHIEGRVADIERRLNGGAVA